MNSSVSANQSVDALALLGGCALRGALEFARKHREEHTSSPQVNKDERKKTTITNAITPITSNASLDFRHVKMG